MNSKKIPVILDVDTGRDDAMALVLACASDRLDIKGVTTVAGNVDLVHTTQNTLNVLDLLGRPEIKVAAGATKPLERELRRTGFIHGRTGLRGYEFKKNVNYALQKEPAWDFTRDIILNSSEKITLICVGPLTNIALLLEKYPEVQAGIEKIVFMGTAFHDGNPTPLATFNVLIDPEAFRAVVHSGLDVYACPLETTRKVFLTEEEKRRIREDMNGPAAKLVRGLLFGSGTAPSPNLHDPATVGFVIAPELFTYSKYYCDVECKGELTTGFTLIDMVDYYGKTESERNLYYLDSVDRARFIEMFEDSIRHFDR